MKSQRRAAALAVLIAAPGLALAQTQAAMNSSAAREMRAADQGLNAQYAATMAKLSAPSKLLLRDAQRSWITFRDQQCKFEASGVKGGTAFPMVISGCLKRLSDDRTRQLRQYGQCEEGDLACPR